MKCIFYVTTIRVTSIKTIYVNSLCKRNVLFHIMYHRCWITISFDSKLSFIKIWEFKTYKYCHRQYCEDMPQPSHFCWHFEFSWGCCKRILKLIRGCNKILVRRKVEGSWQKLGTQNIFFFTLYIVKTAYDDDDDLVVTNFALLAFHKLFYCYMILIRFYAIKLTQNITTKIRFSI